MKKNIEKNVSLASERGFSFRALNHEGMSIHCQNGAMQEIFPGIYVTVDPLSGIGLIEVNPTVPTAKLLLNDQDVLDIVQVSSRDVLSVDGKKYVFLNYMDAFLNADRKRTMVQCFADTKSKVVPFTAAEKQLVKASVPTQVLLSFQNLPKRTKILAAMTALVSVASLFAVLSESASSTSSLETSSSEIVVEDSGLPKPSKIVPQTITELIDGDFGEAPETEAAAGLSPDANKEVPENNDSQKVDVESKSITNSATATSVKPIKLKEIKKEVAKPVPAAAVSESALKAYESDFQEAILIKGYDQERSVRILKQLQKTVPAGTALRQKIDKELR